MRIEHTRWLGVDVNYRLIDDDGLDETVVFLGGLGGTHLVWGGIARRLRGDFDIVIPDYPGLVAGASLPEDAEVSVEDLADYARHVIDHCDLGRYHVVGWSLGAAVGLELARRAEDGRRPASITSVCGGAIPPIRSALEEITGRATPPVTSVLPRAVFRPPADWLTWIAERIERFETLRARLVSLQHPARIAARFGLVAPEIDELSFDAIVRDFVALDVPTYARYFTANLEHDARPAAGELDIPLLTVGGDKDRLVSHDLVRELAELAPNGRYFEVRGGTHYLPLEYPNVAAAAICDFLKRLPR